MAKPELPEDYSIAWEAQPGPQTALISCPVFEIFFGGARGGGKTDGVLGDFLEHADTYGSNAIGLMLRRQRTELIETIERSKAIYSPLGWQFHEQDKMWRAPDGARLRFAYLERDADAEAYQGHSYTRLYVEEIGNFPSDRPILKLMATLRSGAGVPVGFRATGNPGGPGHQWVRARYIDPAPMGFKIITDAVSGLERVYIPSRVGDNRFLGEDYVRQLRASGSEQLIRAWLEGDWSVTEGAFFDCWDSSRHVVRPFEIPKDWLRFRSGDWGSAKPFSFGWWAVVGDDFKAPDGAILPRGCMVRYREWYGCQPGKPNTGLKLHAEIVGEGLLKREKDDKITYGVLDPAAFAEDGGPSIAERMTKAARYKVTFTGADNKRVPGQGALGGWDQMRARMVGDADGLPMIACFSTCVDSIRTIPALQHDKNKPEDLDSDMEDHCFAAGTMVETEAGPVAIERLPETGKVYSLGGLKEYRSARMTRRDAELVSVRFEDGTVVKCTGNHKFFVDTGEWRYAKDLTDLEVICVQSSSARQSKSLMESDIICAGAISRKRESGFTSRFGSTITGLFRPASTSITGMTIDPTMGSAIWNALRSWSTLAANMALRAASELANTFQWPEQPQQRGMALMRAGNGIRSISKSTLDLGWAGESRRSVNNAARNIRSLPLGSLKASSADLIVGRVRCVGVESSGRADVYCLTVPETGCFAIEGGLLVSNCADEWRYACMSRPWIAQKPGKELDRVKKKDYFGRYEDSDDDNSSSWKVS
jgi:hypothetical protein